MRRSALAVFLAVGAPCAAQIGPEVVFTEAPLAPASKREVPGLGGASFDLLDRPYTSGNGQYWVIRGSANLGTTLDDFILLCQGTGGTVIAREGTLTPYDATRTWGLFDQKCSVNNSGSVVFQNNDSGAVTNDEVIARFNIVAGVPTFDALSHREGDPAAPIPPLPTNARWGIDINSPNIVNDGRVGVNVALMADANTVPPVTTTNDQCLVFGTTLLAQQGVTTPVGGLAAWETIAIGDFHVDATGANWIALGDEAGATGTDGVVVVNGTVVLREGTTFIPTLTTSVGAAAVGLAEVVMAPSGDWYARGTNTDVDEDWIVRNGAVVACRKAGHPMNSVTGGAELWGNTDFTATYFLMTGNSLGDYVVGGVTNSAIAANAVLVFNRAGVRTVVCREGDPIDLNGNGIYDDTTFVRAFGNDDAFLTDDGWLYFGLTLTDTAAGSTGLDIGDAILRIRVFTTSCYANCDASTIPPILNVNDFTCFLNRYAAGDTSANCDASTIAPVLNVNDFTCFLNAYAVGCP